MLAKPNPAGLKHQMDPHGCVAGKMPFAGIRKTFQILFLGKLIKKDTKRAKPQNKMRPLSRLAEQAL